MRSDQSSMERVGAEPDAVSPAVRNDAARAVSAVQSDGVPTPAEPTSSNTFP